MARQNNSWRHRQHKQSQQAERQWLPQLARQLGLIDTGRALAK
jgi:hypothetical protein